MASIHEGRLYLVGVWSFVSSAHDTVVIHGPLV